MKMILLLAITVLVNIVNAQIVVFALSIYHINSGIFAPYLLISVAEAAISAGVRTGCRDLCSSNTDAGTSVRQPDVKSKDSSGQPKFGENTSKPSKSNVQTAKRTANERILSLPGQYPLRLLERRCKVGLSIARSRKSRIPRLRCLRQTASQRQKGIRPLRHSYNDTRRANRRVPQVC